MAAVDGSMDDVDAVNADSGAAGTEETASDSPDLVDNANRIEAAKDEDVTDGVVTRKCTHPTSVTNLDSVDDVRDNAGSADPVRAEDSADPPDSGSIEIDDIVGSMDRSTKGGGNECESDGDGDGDSTNETTCLEAMDHYGHDYYLRLGDTPRRRSALRLSRIIARQQLLRRLAQGRIRESYGKAVRCKICD